MGIRFDWKWDLKDIFAQQAEQEAEYIEEAKELVGRLQFFLKQPTYELPPNLSIKQDDEIFTIHLMTATEDKLVLEARIVKVDIGSIVSNLTLTKEVLRYHRGRWSQALKDSMDASLNKAKAERLARFTPLEEETPDA